VRRTDSGTGYHERHRALSASCKRPQKLEHGHDALISNTTHLVASFGCTIAELELEKDTEQCGASTRSQFELDVLRDKLALARAMHGLRWWNRIRKSKVTCWANSRSPLERGVRFGWAKQWPMESCAILKRLSRMCLMFGTKCWLSTNQKIGFHSDKRHSCGGRLEFFNEWV
jgi:hypothetical protein